MVMFSQKAENHLKRSFPEISGYQILVDYNGAGPADNSGASPAQTRGTGQHQVAELFTRLSRIPSKGSSSRSVKNGYIPHFQTMSHVLLNALPGSVKIHILHGVTGVIGIVIPDA